jgi:hypothetical protein
MTALHFFSCDCLFLFVNYRISFNFLGFWRFSENEKDRVSSNIKRSIKGKSDFKNQFDRVKIFYKMRNIIILATGEGENERDDAWVMGHGTMTRRWRDSNGAVAVMVQWRGSDTAVTSAIWSLTYMIKSNHRKKRVIENLQNTYVKFYT